jgi:hypothetical protein
LSIIQKIEDFRFAEVALAEVALQKSLCRSRFAEVALRKSLCGSRFAEVVLQKSFCRSRFAEVALAKVALADFKSASI